MMDLLMSPDEVQKYFNSIAGVIEKFTGRIEAATGSPFVRRYSEATIELSLIRNNMALVVVEPTSTPRTTSSFSSATFRPIDFQITLSAEEMEENKECCACNKN